MKLELKKIVDIAFPTEPTIFKESELENLNKLIKYDDYYRNRSFKYIIAEYPEYGKRVTDGKSYTPAQVPFNYARYIVNKLASWQFEKPIDYNCTSEGSENKAEAIETDIYEIHKKNLMDFKLLQSAVECNISGGVVIKLKYDSEAKQIKIFPRNRMECFPVYEFDDYENISKVHFVAFIDEETVWKQTYSLEKVGDKKVCYIEEAEYKVKEITKPSKVIIEYQPLGVNGKWLDFIPVYIIPNLPQIGELWGTSELEDLIPIIDEINKKYSDLSDSLRFDMFAITILLNVNSTDENKKSALKAKPGAVWELMGGGTDSPKSDVFKLEGQFQYIEPLRFLIDKLEAAIFEFSECVNLSVDKITGLNSLSGVALKLLFAAVISKTAKKNIIWTSKIREMWFGVLKMKQVYEGYEIPDDLDIEIITHMPIPQNELEQVTIHVQKIAAGLEAVETAMNELGIEDPEAEIAKILEEKVQIDKKLNEPTKKTSTETTE